jgi:hypothetical protein
MEEPERPIFSSRMDDPELADAIDAFVVGLAERVDHLQDAEAHRNLEQLSLLATRLAADAEKLGFAYLATSAGAVEAACSAEDASAAHKSVVEVTHVSQRVRLGHRGSS